MVKADVVVGKTKSGRPWKANHKPIHTMTTTKNVKTSWAKKMAMKRDHAAMKVFFWSKSKMPNGAQMSLNQATAIFKDILTSTRNSYGAYRSI